MATVTGTSGAKPDEKIAGESTPAIGHREKAPWSSPQGYKFARITVPATVSFL